MIFRSLKKHPITRRIKLVSATSSVLSLFCVGGAIELASGQNLISLEFEAGPAEAPAVQLIGVEEVQAEEPLNRLRRRSPEARWNSVKREALPTPSPTVSEPLPTLDGFEEFPPVSSQNNAVRPQPVTLQQNASTTKVYPSIDRFTTSQTQSSPASERSSLPELNTQTLQSPPRLLDSNVSSQFDPFSNALPIPESREVLTREYVSQDVPLHLDTPKTPLRPLGQILPYYDYESIRPGLQLDPEELPPGIDVNRVPQDVEVTELPSLEQIPRLSPDTVFSWEASDLWHNPLYFEDPTLERYGHVAPLLQPLLSTGRLGVQLFGLPYQMSIDPVRKKRYTLGWYRPGDEVPHQFYQIPFNLKAAAVEAGAISTGVVILP